MVQSICRFLAEWDIDLDPRPLARRGVDIQQTRHQFRALAQVDHPQTVNGVTYAFDDNGNLLNDGVNDYTGVYPELVVEPAETLPKGFCSRSIPVEGNRLKTLSGQGNNVTYAYNGLGDRLQETVNGQTTTFTMDLNTGLTQALSDGTNKYIYGLGRIAQTYDTTTEYFLGDTLGSVRQMTNAGGVITYTKAYDPYGVVTTANGSSSTAYGYTGKFTSNDMVYLRSRHYTPDMGRFLTRDTWGGNTNSPMSYNKWNYVGSNPINRTDPTGQCWYPNSNNGGISYDVTDSSPALCSWFINAFQSNGITIQANATPDNWLDSIPPEHRSLITSLITCVIIQNGTILSPSNHDLWQVIRFYTRPKWQYYSTMSAGTSVEFSLFGVGGDLEFSCDNNSYNCTAGGNFGLGVGLGGNIMGYKMEMSAGLGLSFDSTGSIQVGGTVDAGPCGLFVNFVRISVECSIPPFTKEWGWTRGALPQEYWVLVKPSVIGNMPYEDFAKSFLPFRSGSKIKYRVEDLGSREYLAVTYSRYIDYIFE